MIVTGTPLWGQVQRQSTQRGSTTPSLIIQFAQCDSDSTLTSPMWPSLFAKGPNLSHCHCFGWWKIAAQWENQSECFTFPLVYDRTLPNPHLLSPTPHHMLLLRYLCVYVNSIYHYHPDVICNHHHYQPRQHSMYHLPSTGLTCSHPP